MPATDQSLLRRIQEGSQDAATQMYLRYAHRLRALTKKQSSSTLATRVDPDDIVQSVFRTFFRRAAQGGYEIPDGEELWKVFLVIALNKIRSEAVYHTADKRDIRRTSPMGSEALGSARQDEMALATLQIVIEEILGPLPAPSRLIVDLRIQGYDVQDISKKTGRAKRSVERVLQEFRKSLNRVLNGHE